MFGFVVLGTDAPRALKGQVFKKVSDARFALRFVHATDIGIGQERNHRSLVPLHHNEVDAIGQGELGDLLTDAIEVGLDVLATFGGSTGDRGTGWVRGNCHIRPSRIGQPSPTEATDQQQQQQPLATD